MKIQLVFVTYNRLAYTRRSLSSVLADPSEEFSLVIWDNGSTDGTAEYLKHEVDDPRVCDIVLSRENLGQTGAMNYAWSRTDADLVGKVDNDCLLPAGWTRILAQAHRDIPELGAVACWHFRRKDFKYELGRRKIQRFGAHRIFRHPWVGGTGFLIKRETFLRQGPWESGADVGTTHYFLRMAAAGCVNGWYYPLVVQEHMDDPVSEYTLLKNDAAIAKLHDISYTLRVRDIQSLGERMARRKVVLQNLMRDPWEAKYYIGLRAKIRNGLSGIRKTVGL